MDTPLLRPGISIKLSRNDHSGILSIGHTWDLGARWPKSAAGCGTA